nr:class I SAM-dependent methyltransferase [Sphingobium boeckii]
MRRIRRDRAACLFRDHDFLRRHMEEELLDRLDGVKRTFAHALDLGVADGVLAAALRGRGIRVTTADPGFDFAHASGGVLCDEDHLPFADASFDLVISAGGLESVNDLPGALTLIRRVLQPDGLFLAVFPGAGTLAMLKGAMIAADMATGKSVYARIHPQIDVRAGGDLLARAGFALPVSDGLSLAVRYSDIFTLFADLRGMGLTNLLPSTRTPLTRTWLTAVAAAFADRADLDGKVSERFDLVCLTAWSPGPEQPLPARRGSATTSLAAALKPRN